MAVEKFVGRVDLILEMEITLKQELPDQVFRILRSLKRSKQRKRVKSKPDLGSVAVYPHE